MLSFNMNVLELHELEIISKYCLIFQKKNVPIVSGIYLLFFKGELIRVGQSVNIWERLYNHNGTKKHTGSLQYSD